MHRHGASTIARRVTSLRSGWPVAASITPAKTAMGLWTNMHSSHGPVQSGTPRPFFVELVGAS
jgi:hypothetical protein